MKKIISLLLLVTSIAFSQTGVTPLNVVQYPSNTVNTNTISIGNKANRSLYFKTNDQYRLKIDSLGNFIWNIGSAGSPLYYNTFILAPLPTFTQIPCAWMGIHPSQRRADNYVFLADTTNFVINSNRGMFFRNHGVTWLQTYTEFIGNTTGNADLVQFIGSSGNFTCTTNATVTDLKKAAAVTRYSTGTVPAARCGYFQGNTRISNGTTTITDDVAWEFTWDTPSTGMTFGNRLGHAIQGNTNVWGNSYISGSTTRSVFTPNAILHLGAGGASLPAMALTAQTAVSSPTAGNLWYETTRGFLHNGNVTAIGNVSVSANTTLTGATNITHTLGVTTATAGLISEFRDDAQGRNYIRVRNEGSFVNASTGLEIYTNVAQIGTFIGQGSGVTIGNAPLGIAGSALGISGNGVPIVLAPTGTSALTNGMVINTNNNVLINTNTDAPSAKLNVVSTTQGVLFPRMTTAQKNAISSPAEGLIVYDTDLHKLCVRTAATWETITSL